MEMNILIKAEERLLNVLERLAKAWETSLHTQGTTTSATGDIKAPAVTAEKTDASELSDDAKTAENEYPALDPKTYKDYEQYKQMLKKLSELAVKVGALQMVDLVKKWSTKHVNDTETIPPNSWWKVISEAVKILEATKKVPEPEPKTEAEADPAQVTDISEEELRTACTMAKNAGVNVPHYLESIAGVKRVTKVPEGLRIKVKEALEAEMGGMA